MNKLFISVILIFITSQNIYTQYLPEPKLKQNFPIELEKSNYGFLPSAQFYDLDNDGYLEIILSSGNYIHIIRRNGENFPGWPKYLPYSNVTGPAIGDIDGDGYKEIIAVSSTRNPGFGGVYVWRTNGDDMPGFPVTFQDPESGSPVGPTIYDINKDGKLEIFFRRWYKVYGLDWRGKVLPGWPQTIPNGYFGMSVPKISDVDFDSIPEIFVSATYTEWVDTTSYFMIVCYQPDGTIKAGWPFIRKDQFLFSVPLGAISQFQGNDYKVIAFGTSIYRKIYNCYFYLLNPLGEVIKGWPKELEDPLFGHNSAIFLNYKNQSAKGRSDVVIAGGLFGYLYAWEEDGTSLPMFPFELPGINGPFAPGVPSVPIPYHDLENKEFVLFTNADITKNDTGYVFASRSNATQMAWSPLKVNGLAASTPAFADLENDGTVEMVMATKTADQINLYVWEFTDIPYDKQRFPWPVGNANRWNTGEFGFEPTDTVIVSVRNENGLPSKIKLYQNYPNPFNASTKIKYDIDRNTKVRLSVYNILGQEVVVLVDSEQRAGSYEAVWDARKYPSGVYYVKMESNNYKSVQKLIMIK
ncbi:MAG: FG-GAP-like repeat-containing protein [Bacteroidota bacterium]|nr:FG-GAP-like repeat-containing protein [Bacteroidota bacterium]